VTRPRKAKRRKPVPGTRPTRAGAPSDVRIAVLATGKERDDWHARASAAGTTLSEVARRAWDALPPAR
jgi:hypothetical protein